MNWLSVFFVTYFFLAPVSLHADIVTDEVLFDDFVTRTQYFGSLSLSSSAGRQFNTTTYRNTRGIAWSPDSNLFVASFLKNDGQNGYDVMFFQNKTLQILAQLDIVGTGHDNGAANFSPLAWNITGTTGCSYVAVPIVSGTNSNYTFVQVYKFNNFNSLQMLPNARASSGLTGYWVDAVWSPNGQFLLAGFDRGFSLYSFDGTYLYLISTTIYNQYTEGSANNHGLTWSPDGKYIGFIDRSSQVHIYTFDGSTVTALLNTSISHTGTNEAFEVLRFHPTLPVFALAMQYSSDGLQRIELYSFTTAGSYSSLQTIQTGENGWSNTFDWSPDGSYFVAGGSNVYTYSFNGTTASQVGSQLAINPGSTETTASWSPDGRYIAFGLWSPASINSISTSLVQLYTTGLNPSASLADVTATALSSSVTNIVTSTASHYWGISTSGDLKFSSTEVSITRMRGRWETATSQGSLVNSNLSYLINNSLDGNFYAIDRMGSVHKSGSVVVGPQVRINWTPLSGSSSSTPIFTSIYQGVSGLFGIDINSVIYRYLTTTGWVRAGTAGL